MGTSMAGPRFRRGRSPKWYHAVHEASHAVLGIASRLQPKQITIGHDPLGTRGGIDFSRALSRDRQRYLLIAVAGRVGTRLFGYKNRLVSEQLVRLGEREPSERSWNSDAFNLWYDGYSLLEVRAAEREARQVLKRRLALVGLLADVLHTKGSLTKEEIIVITQRAAHAR